MDITLRIHHCHSMSYKRHELSVESNTLHTVEELKQAVTEQYPSKINHFISPPRFQKLVMHGRIWDDAQTVGDLLGPNTTRVFPRNSRRDGQIVLLQFPRTDKHLRQIHAIIADKEKLIRPMELSRRLAISVPRVMKIIHWLEAAGFVQIDSSTPPSLQSSGTLHQSPPVGARLAALSEHTHHELAGITRVDSTGSIASAVSLDDGWSSAELLRTSFVRLVIGELAQQLLFRDEQDEQENPAQEQPEARQNSRDEPEQAQDKQETDSHND